jgi:hypothetical protein
MTSSFIKPSEEVNQNALFDEFEGANGPKIKLVTEARHTFGHKAAAQLWKKLGLPEVPAMYHEPVQDDLSL